MGLTLSHLSALDVVRTLRSEGEDLRSMDAIRLASPMPWMGKRWNVRAFDEPSWKWGVPSAKNPLHVLVPQRSRQIRMTNVESHSIWKHLPSGSILWLDEHSSVVCPELLFVQMAETFSLPALVMLGYELCGGFSRQANDPLNGEVTLDIPAITSIESLRSYTSAYTHTRGAGRARQALEYVSNNAVSAPEAVLATVYSLPPSESGYGLGPVTLNARVRVSGSTEESNERYRYPDIMFPFAPVGLNYDGADHLDLEGLVQAARFAELAEGDLMHKAIDNLSNKLQEVRAKAVDDIRRNRELASQGKVVFPVTKEDLYGWGSLDELTIRILDFTQNVFNIDVEHFRRTLNNTSESRDRNDLIASLLPGNMPRGVSHGRL